MRRIFEWTRLLCWLPVPAIAAVSTVEDPQTGLRSWTWTEHGVSLQLVQRLPDQNRAFFAARGFGRAEADRIARACVFQTIFRNDGALPLDYDLDAWTVLHGGVARSLLTRERWADTWRGSTVGRSAQIAQHWALLPTRQRFEPGDYNWGMTSFGLPPGAVFDLELVVTFAGEPARRRIAGIACAEDRTGTPP